MSNKSNHDEVLMTVREVAGYLRISPATVYNWAKGEKIPCHRLGRLWRFKRNEIDDWVAKRRMTFNSTGKGKVLYTDF